VFAGSPAAAVPSLRRLLSGPHRVVAVVTREDAPLGRKKVLTATPVADEAEREGIPVIKANRLSAVTDELIALEADLGVIVAYGGLIREPLLSAPAARLDQPALLAAAALARGRPGAARDHGR
jgi:methionyl-tRNA formyltransferase (EC 2.1.2.9)